MDNKDGVAVNFLTRDKMINKKHYKKLAVFGCSWSYGMPDIGEPPAEKILDCWPSRFALANPSYIVYNFAKGGTGIGYHIALMNQFIQSPLYTKGTKIVFQVTNPYRYTYNIKECLDTELNWMTVDNYNVECGRKPRTMKATDERRRWARDSYTPAQVKFFKNYIKYYPEHLVDIEFQGQMAYVKNIADFVYAHQLGHYTIPVHFRTKYNRISVVRDNLGKEKFDSFVIDDGAHFGPEGFAYMAKWVEGNLYA